MILNTWCEEMKRIADGLRKRHYVDMVADIDRWKSTATCGPISSHRRAPGVIDVRCPSCGCQLNATPVLGQDAWDIACPACSFTYGGIDDHLLTTLTSDRLAFWCSRGSVPAPKAKMHCNQPGPPNNDGRATCFWCGAPTKSVGCTATLMQVCTACGK